MIIIKNINYSSFKIQEYITSGIFTNTEVEILMSFRSYSVRDFNKCFPSMYGGGQLMCKLSCNNDDSPEHLLQCQPLCSQLRLDAQIEATEVKYYFLFGSLSQQKRVVNIISQLLEIRKKLTNKS